MADYVIAYEYEDPGPADHPTRTLARAHAYDADEGEAAHPIKGSYSVQADEPWSALARVERCAECVRLVGGRHSGG